MAAPRKKRGTVPETLTLDSILFKCRDILRQARNSGSFFEKRDMMLTLVFLRFIGEKFEDGIEKLRNDLKAQGFDLDDPDIKAAFLEDPTFTDGTYNLLPEARWSTIINTPAPGLNVALDTALNSIASNSAALRGCFVEGTFTTRNLAPNDIKKLVDEVNKISHKLGDEADSSFSHDLHKGLYFNYIMANPPFNLKDWFDENLRHDARWADYSTPPESNANYAWILHILSHLKPLDGVAGFLLANGALGDGDTLAIRQKLIENDKVEAIVILPRKLFITTDISVTLWILNQNKKGGAYHGRKLRNREHQILFMDLRTWSENPVKNEQKKKVRLVAEQIERAASIYHTWQNEGTDGTRYEVPELYRSVGMAEIKENGWSLVPSKYIEFVDHDLKIDFPAEMKRIQREMRDIIAKEKQSQKRLKKAFKGIGYGLD